MKIPVLLLAGTTTVLLLISWMHGYGTAYSLAYGAIVALSLSISATFFWLWYARTTPLALGMAFSWAGAAGVMGWWWIYQLLSAPDAMVENRILFLFVSSYFVGGLLHFQVIFRSLGARSVVILLPLALFLGFSFVL